MRAGAASHMRHRSRGCIPHGQAGATLGIQLTEWAVGPPFSFTYPMGSPIFPEAQAAWLPPTLHHVHSTLLPSPSHVNHSPVGSPSPFAMHVGAGETWGRNGDLMGQMLILCGLHAACGPQA